jgi:hypothetical protein
MITKTHTETSTGRDLGPVELELRGNKESALLTLIVDYIGVDRRTY